MTSVKKAIKIFARIKPTDAMQSNYEVEKHINDDGSIEDIFTMNTNNSESTEDLSNNNAPRSDSYKFRFAKVFEESANQETLFTEMCKPVLDTALEGYNSTIFAYGQTGSGKTFTMTGSRQNWKHRGIIPRSISYIFEKFTSLTSQGFITSAFLSYLEIYNENGYDLLHSGLSSGRIEDLKKVQLLEDSQQQIHIKNLTVHPIKSEDEAMQLLYMGDHNRIVAETPMNEASTRSHCVFTIHLNIRESDSSTVKRSKVHLVDLAGSERLSNSSSTGQLFNESRHINLALHYLEQVIVALGETNRSHIPYRNSMMTSILRDSLGGNCMTSMVATLSLDYRNLMETLSTCRFSQRVALVQNAAMMNEETDPMLLIAQLKAENRRLKEIIASSSVKGMELNMEPVSQEEVSDCWKLVEKFISDQDDEAILPVIPDMRIVQTCFKCLKVAVNMSKTDLVEKTNHTPHSPRRSKHKSRSSRGETKNKVVKSEELVKGDHEFESRRAGSTGHRSRRDSSRRSQRSPLRLYEAHQCFVENGDNKLQQLSSSQSPKGAYGGKEVEEYSPNTLKQTPTGIHPSEYLQPRTHAANACCLPPNNSLNDFTCDNLMLEGMPEKKRKGLCAFLSSYHGTDKLAKMQESFISKRNNLSNIEVQLHRNQANLNNLKLVLMSCDESMDEEDVFMREAVTAQDQSVQKQEKQVELLREDVRKTEQSLRVLYNQLLSEFERHFNNGQDTDMVSKEPSEILETIRLPRQSSPPRPYQLEIDDIPSESDIIALGQSAASTCAVFKAPSSAHAIGNTHHNSCQELAILSPSSVEKVQQQKPLAEMTKGLVKGVGGATAPQSFSMMSFKQGSKNSLGQAHSQFLVPTKKISPALTMRTSVDHLSPRAHISPLDSPVDSLQNSARWVSAVRASESARMERNRSAPKSSESPTDAQQQNEQLSFLDDDEDDDMLNDLPMTGDETIDQEILSFFRTRQAVFKKIKNDKNGHNES